MSARLCPVLLAAVLSAGLSGPVQAAAVSAEAIEAATYSGGALPGGVSALTAKVQILLDRAGISPGVIDGIKGGMSRSAIAAFERRSNLPADGVMDMRVWAALQPYAGEAFTADYTITEADAANLTRWIPDDYLEKANMTSLGYTSVAEKLGERFHMDDDFIEVMNPGVALTPGTTIKVVAPSDPSRAKVTRIVIDKGTNRVSAFDASGRMVVNYPSTIGSAQTPSPSGTHKVSRVALNPEYTYNPSKNFQQGSNDQVLTLPPGPNGPVGSVWIALTKPTYGIHGTPTPSRLFVSESHGCVRLTNWDAQELAHMVQPGVTSVEFVEKGSSPKSAPATAASAEAAPVTQEVQDAQQPVSLQLGTSAAPRRKPVIEAAAPAPVAPSAEVVAPETPVPAAAPAVSDDAVDAVDPLTAAVQAAIPETADVTVSQPAGADSAAE